MEAVKLLVENEDKLNLSWSHGCHYNGNEKGYSMGLMGRIGALGPGVPEPKKVPRTGFPDSLSFTVEFKEVDDTLYNKLCPLLEEKEVGVLKRGSEVVKVEKRVKAEFEEQVKLIKDEYNKKNIKIDMLMEQIKELKNAVRELGGNFYDNGCCSDDEYCESKMNIPQHYYEDVKIISYMPQNIQICCHKGTEIYKELEKSGLLRKYCPKSYSDGSSYSADGKTWF